MSMALMNRIKELERKHAEQEATLKRMQEDIESLYRQLNVKVKEPLKAVSKK